MPRTLTFQLDKSEQDALALAMKRDKRPEVRQRATAVRLLAQGEKPKAVAETMAVSEVSIYAWWHRYQGGGLDGLANRPKGRPETQADAEYLQRLRETVECEPAELGYDFAIWTTERLRDHLAQRTGVHLSVGYLRTVMRQLGYVYRRPKHDLTNLQDAEAKAAAQVHLDELKKGRTAVISGFSLWTKRR
jgi:transposase